MFTDKQKGVVKGALTAWAIVLTGLACMIYFQPGRPITAPLKWDILLALSLVAAIGRVANRRFDAPEDIDGAGLTEGTAIIKVQRAILQNTLEQVVIAFITHALWAMTMPTGWQAAIPFACICFVAGRILFTLGYSSGAAGRALGFALTFYPSIAMLVLVFARMIGTWSGMWI